MDDGGEDALPDVVDYLSRPPAERLADAWPEELPDTEEVIQELRRQGVNLADDDLTFLIDGDEHDTD